MPPDWHKKASRTALQPGSNYHTRTLFWYRHTHMTTVKENAEQYRQLKLSLNNE